MTKIILQDNQCCIVYKDDTLLLFVESGKIETIQNTFTGTKEECESKIIELNLKEIQFE